MRHCTYHRGILKEPCYSTQTQRCNLKFFVEIQSCFTIEGAHFQEVCWCPFCTLPALAVANTREKIRLVFLRWVWTAVRVMKIDTAHAIFQG